MSNVIAMKQLLEAGVHFGHQTRRWNPKMAEYIFTERNGIYIIDLQKTAKKIEEAYAFVKEVAESGKEVLFVGTKKQAQDSIKEEAERVGMYWVNARWLGGMMTNFKTIKKRIERLEQLTKMEEDGTFDLLPKKEVINLKAEREKLEAEEPKTDEDTQQRYERLAKLKSDEIRLRSDIEALEKEKEGIVLTLEDLARVIEIWTGIPSGNITEHEFSKIGNLKARLADRIIGQDEAIDSVVKAIKRNRAGVSYKKKPVSFIFAGPTGVGKTELVKVLSEDLFSFHAVAFDPHGRLGWKSDRIVDVEEDPGYDKAQIIEVLTRQVDGRYLTYLQKLGIFIRFCGDEQHHAAHAHHHADEPAEDGVELVLVSQGAVKVLGQLVALKAQLIHKAQEHQRRRTDEYADSLTLFEVFSEYQL